MDTNFHARYEAKLNELEGDELVEYMIKCIPFINKYNGQDSDESTKSQSVFGSTRIGGIKKNDIFTEYLERVEDIRPSHGPSASRYSHNNII